MNQEPADLPPKERIKTILCTLDKAAQMADLGQRDLNPVAIRKMVADLQTAIQQMDVRS